MGDEPGPRTSLTGKGVYPYQAARSLLNPLRALVLSPAKLLTRLSLDPGMVVLEIGPGPGYYSPAVAAAVPEGKLLLFDLQQEMLDMATDRLNKAGITNFEVHCGDAGSLPFEDDSVDAVFLVTVLGEVVARESCLAEIRRTLRPGGLLSVSEMRGDPDRLPLAVVKNMSSAAGFLYERTWHGLMHYTLNTRKPCG